MSIDYYIACLNRNRGMIGQFVSEIGDEQGSWKPASDKWSVLEVVNHLYDEEREDFRMRLKNTLSDPEKPWDPIAPAEWVTERRYADRNLAESLERFLDERDNSIIWLNTLSDPNWSNSYNHQSGDITAGDLIASWVAHDLLHLKQIIKLDYDYLRRLSKPFSVGYAGEWK